MDKLSRSDPEHFAGQDLPADLEAVANRYTALPVPGPSPLSSQLLTQRLLTEASGLQNRQQSQPGTSLWQMLSIIYWRLYLLGSSFWLAWGLLLLPAGLIFAHVSRTQAVTGLIVFIPLLTLLSLLYALAPSSQGLSAVEASCPVNALQVTLSLALTLLLCDILLSLLVTTLFALLNYAPFWNLLLAWLTPLLLLTTLLLPLTLLSGLRQMLLMGGLPWIFLGGMALLQRRHNPTDWLFALPTDTLTLSWHLLVVALSLFFLGLLLGSTPRWEHLCALYRR